MRCGLSRLALLQECLKVFQEVMPDMDYVCLLPQCHPDYLQWAPDFFLRAFSTLQGSCFYRHIHLFRAVYVTCCPCMSLKSVSGALLLMAQAVKHPLYIVTGSQDSMHD